jgi:hypothetical protein
MNSQAWIIADLTHRNWKLKYLPENYRAEDIKDNIHPYYRLLQTFDTLRELNLTLDDLTVLSKLESKLKQLGKIIDNMINVKEPILKGIIDMTALTAYVHTVNDLWIKKSQLIKMLIITPSETLTYKGNEIINEIIKKFDIWIEKPQLKFWNFRSVHSLV